MRLAILITACSLAIVSCSRSSQGQASSSAPGATSAGVARGGSAASSAGAQSSLTPALRKLDTPVLYEVYRARGIADVMAVPPGPTGVQVDPQGRALVDVRGAVTDALQQRIKELGGVVLSITPTDASTIASMPLLAIEPLAAEPGVTAIRMKATAQSGRGR